MQKLGEKMQDANSDCLRFVRACAVEMHMDMSQQHSKYGAEILGKC